MNRPISAIGLLSETYCSNLFTKSAAFNFDKRQVIPAVAYTVPDAKTRLLLAKLVFEEAQETIHALGCILSQTNDGPIEVVDDGGGPLSLEKVIDGACDTIYVATGVLAACGVPDMPHLTEVCDANNAKFPNGVAIIDPKSGKYLKPEGWKAPDHMNVKRTHQSFDPLKIKNDVLINNKETK